MRAILCAPIPLRAMEKIRLTTSAASGSMMSFPFAFGSLQYPYRAKEPMNSPSFRLWSSTERTLVDRSSRYHSLIRPLIWRDFLFAVSLVSTWSTTAMKRTPHSMNFPCRYFSTSSMSRVKRDCVLASTTSNRCSLAACSIELNAGRFRSMPE